MNVREIVAYCKSLREQMVREPLPAKRIAAGWALGMFGGCFIPFGMQLIVTVPLSVLWRVSKIGATVGTLITNPVTIFFIYPAQCWVGSRLIGSPLSWAYLRGEVYEKLAHASVFSAEGWRIIADLGGRVLGGFFAGGLLLALVMTPITYFFVLRIVTTFRNLRIVDSSIRRIADGRSSDSNTRQFDNSTISPS